MTPLTTCLLAAPTAALAILSTTAVLLARLALHNTESRHRAAILRSLAHVLSDLRGRRR